MALQVTKTGDLGNTISYWRVRDVTLQYEDTWATGEALAGQLFRFRICGYHDADYRSKNATVESHQYVVDGSEQAAIISTTSGDLRPAIYDWLKNSETGQTGGPAGNGLGAGFFSEALNI